MSKKILSIIMMLALAISVIIGTVVVANANEDTDGVALTLEDSITAHVQIINCTGASYANISLKDGDKVVKTYENVSFAAQNGSTVIVSVELAVKELYSTVVVDVMGENGAILRTYECSVVTYLNDIVENGATEGEKLTAEALLKYAYVAKDYFAGLSMDAPADETFDAPAKGAEGSVTGITHYGTSLVLESETTIRHYFKVEGDIAGYTFYVDYDMDGGYDEICDYGKYETEQVAPEAYGSYYCVDIKGIAPNDLDRSYKLCVTDGTDTYSYNYSAMNYAEDAWGTASGSLKSLLSTLKGYLAGASEMSANIIYNLGDSQTTVPYQFGVDNYLEAPASVPAGYVFAGWYKDASFTTPADGMIPAGSIEDVNVYGKLIRTLYTPDNSMAMADAITGSLSGNNTVTITDKTDYVEYNFSAALSGHKVEIPNYTGDSSYTLIDMIDDLKAAGIEQDSYTFKYTMNLHGRLDAATEKNSSTYFFENGKVYTSNPYWLGFTGYWNIYYLVDGRMNTVVYDLTISDLDSDTVTVTITADSAYTYNKAEGSTTFTLAKSAFNNFERFWVNYSGAAVLRLGEYKIEAIVD